MGTLHIKKKIIKIGGPFLTTKSSIFGTKVDFFPIGTFRIQNFPNFNKFILSKLHIKKKNNKNRSNFFFEKNPQFSEQKWIFFQLEQSESQIFEISRNLFYLSYILKKNNKNRSNFFSEKNPQLSEQKWIFFPIGTFRIPNFPNFNKFILSKLHIKKK